MIRSLALGLVVGAVFLALALWGVPLGQVGSAVWHMSPLWVAATALGWVVQYLLRAWRQVLLVRGLAPATTYRRQLSITVVGFFCINTFPARLGEVARPFLLYERDGVPVGAGLALFFLERIIDLVALLVALLIVVFAIQVPDRAIEIFGRTIPLVDLVRGSAVAVLGPVVASVLGLALFGRPAVALGERVLAAVERIGRLVLDFAGSFVGGIASLRDPRRLVGIALLTAVLFVLMGAMTWTMGRAFSFGQWIGYREAVGVLGITMLGIALPAPPGFAGVFEASVRAALAVFGVRGEELAAPALGYALVFHWGPYLLLTLWAGWFLWRDGIALGRVFRFARGRTSDVEVA
jgi:uncharacterized membrane protein YbhN (UPF0104 family)